MTIYRLETEDGRGPYVGGPPIYACEGAAHGLPTPAGDPHLRRQWGSLRTNNYSFGFENVEALLVWFANPSYRSEAEQEGYAVSVIEASSEIHGTFQSIFIRDDAVRVGRLTFEYCELLSNAEVLSDLTNRAAMFRRYGAVELKQGDYSVAGGLSTPKFSYQYI